MMKLFRAAQNSRLKLQENKNWNREEYGTGLFLTCFTKSFTSEFHHTALVIPKSSSSSSTPEGINPKGIRPGAIG
jgi:hypothetical protein